MSTDMSAQPYFEVLSRAECVRLLPTATIARLAFCEGDEAHVYPVNAFIYQEEVIVRSGYGGKLAAAAHGATFTVEADEVDAATRTGWVVNVMGRARVIEDLDDLAMLELADVRPWAPGEKEFFIGVSLDTVTGRRITRPVAR
ncbi:MAG TPA: pyridoxamine 5'-phosphate oxidase family protein [Actinomycetales bacterium]|nr:pyridoxamine 5'-phosphate oxidase family protein [Actinomycetales bacterium]